MILSNVFSGKNGTIRFSLIITVLLFLTGIFCLFQFPLHNFASVWKGYRVLVVSLDESEQDIIRRLEAAGIGQYVSQSNSILKNSNPETPDFPFLPALNSQRSAWFVDTAHSFRFLYLEEKPFLDRKTEKAFSDAHFFWHLEKSEKQNMVSPVLSLFLAIAGLLLSKNRLSQIVCAVPFILLSFSDSLASGAISAYLALYSIILLASLFDDKDRELSRSQVIMRLKSYPVLFLPPLGALISAFSGGVKSALLFLAAVVSSFSVLFLFNAGEKILGCYRRDTGEHPVFRMQVMHPGTVRRKISGKVVVSVSAATIILSLFSIFPFFSLYGLAPKNQDEVTLQDLYIPAPSGYTGRAGFDIDGYLQLIALKSRSGIPDLGDFISAQWRIYTFPWQRIQSPAEQPTGKSVAEYSVYSIDGNGVISGKKRIMDIFDTGFIKKTLAENSTPLEKMLIRQGRYVTVARINESKPRSGTRGRKSDALYMVFLLIPGTAILKRLKNDTFYPFQKKL
jgi:hypothetical protein